MSAAPAALVILFLLFGGWGLWIAFEASNEIARLRTAITAAVADLDGTHYPDNHDDGRPPWCAMCGAADGAWPCASREVADDLRRAVET